MVDCFCLLDGGKLLLWFECLLCCLVWISGFSWSEVAAVGLSLLLSGWVCFALRWRLLFIVRCS